MYTAISITGQISGNFTLLSAIGHGYKKKDTQFNGFEVKFRTKKEAITAIREAYNSLVQDEPERKGKLSGIRVNKNRTELYYDASKAIII